jgi:hypothetical protein
MRITSITHVAAAVALALFSTVTSAAQSARIFQGVVVADDDPSDRTEIFVVLSAAYRPILQLETSSGTREAEVESVGQTFQFVPPGGGVRTMRVEALDASPDRVHVAISSTFEQASGGILEQSWYRTLQTLVREGDAFHATFENASGTRLSDLDLAVGGDVQTKIYRGILRLQ